MQFVIILGVMLMLAGCAVSTTKNAGADGQPEYVLNCSGVMREREDCLAKAGAICTQGYAVVGDKSQTKSITAVENSSAVTTDDYLTISCRSGRGE